MANDNLPNGVRSLLASQGKTYISLETEASGDGNTFAFERDDYTPDSMEIVNRMAVDTVFESQNFYKLKDQRIDVRITQDNGKPSLIADGGPGAINSYTSIISDWNSSDNDTSGVREFEKLSNSEQFFGLDNQFEVIKGNAEPTNNNQKKYITLLVDYNKEKSNSTIAKAVGELQTKNNRFSETNRFLIDGQKENESGANVIPIQNIPGQYTPQVWPNTETGTNVELRNLKNLGIQLLLKACGEYYIPDDLDDLAGALAAKAASTVPGYVRQGWPLPMSEIQVDNIINNTNPEFSKNKSPSLSGTPTLSHGSYYSPLAPFDSFDGVTSVALNSVLIGTVAGIVNLLAKIVNDQSKPISAASVFGTNSKSFFAKYEPVHRSDDTPQQAYIKCVNKGFQLFFFGTSSSPLDNISQSPGYYSTVSRGIVRMVQYDIVKALFQVSDQVATIVGVEKTTAFNAATNRDLDINRNVGLTNDFTNIGNIVRSFGNSKLFNFINILAQLGDNALILEEAGIAPDSNSDPLKISKSDYDSKLDFVEESNDFGNSAGGAEYIRKNRNRINPASLIYRDRLSTSAAETVGFDTKGKKHLAWASSTTPSTYLLPKTIINASAQLGDTGQNNIVTKLSSINGIVKYDSGNRLPSEMVDKIESLLDSSYMPFYFHDLRTNEIISFHAFLESVSDNFSAEYNEQTAYGRIGKISTYKNTDRSISLSFLTVATNEEDFDEMWWKINKLITMVYPQYTKGRQIERGNQKFIQPFSQLPSASPLIRLRLGDLFKTNYSKFHLARLFGLGEQNELFNVIPVPNITEEQITQQNQEREKLRRRLESGNFQIGDKFVYIVEELEPDPVPFGEEIVNSIVSEIIDRSIGLVISVEETRKLKKKLRRTQREIQNQPPRGAIGTITAKIETGVDDGVNARYIYEASFDGRQEPYKVFVDKFMGSKTRFKVDTNYLEQKVREAIPAPPALPGAQEQLQQDGISFFNDSNPIFQSFNTVRGKGLPGFIKSIEFDWGEMLWETGMDNRAPKTCKISISFSPIWDISPGIDSNGFNTAPVYGVGDSTNELSKTHFGDNNTSSNTTMKLLGSAKRTPSATQAAVGAGAAAAAIGGSGGNGGITGGGV